MGIATNSRLPGDKCVILNENVFLKLYLTRNLKKTIRLFVDRMLVDRLSFF